ncbi:MAG: ATP-binding protein [Dehalococcoidia bacterium]|nr:ATP-binding protein [Dehalococcoidia bacterium]
MNEPERARPGMMNEQQRARLESIKRTWQQKREITESLGRIKNKIAVYSGKGGVGKTTIAVGIAVTLARQGFKVGIFDADIDCPNVTKLMGLTNRPEVKDNRFYPPEKHGVKVISMSFFQEREDEAIIWRGPMVHNAINQFLQMTEWGELDYLIVDLPPGTSDAPLTIMQTLPLDGFIIVTTPQALAKMDALRSLNMVRKMNLKVIGVVENFSGDVFGYGAGEDLAMEAAVHFLGRLEMRKDYRQREDEPAPVHSSAVRREFEALLSRALPTLETLKQGVQQKLGE